METLQRFCNAMKIDLPFLMATEIPITPENMEMFEKLHYSNVIEEYKKLKLRMQSYESNMVLRQAV